MHKIDSIQDLRGFAVLYVVLFHAGRICGLPAFYHGDTGVLLFFVISGFIIARVHAGERGPAAAWRFAKRRAARIYPAYFLPFLAMLVLVILAGRGNADYRDPLNILRNLFLVQDPGSSIHPYAWSLVYEISFYALFGLLVTGFGLPLAPFALLLVLPYLLSVSSFGAPWMQSLPLFSYYNLFFSAGILVQVLAETWTLPRISPALVLAAFLLFIALPFLTTDVLLWGAAAALFFLAGLAGGRSLPWLRRIGDASYSIYLVHAVVLSVLKNLVAARTLPMFLLLVGASLAAGLLYHQWLEKPLLERIRG